jgi:NTP pyrophosphatase (non-canonical NTP hydrolase)
VSDKTHLEETVEKMGLLIVWLLGHLGIPEEKAREGVAQLAKEEAERQDKLERELADELGKVLDPLLEQAKARAKDVTQTIERMKRDRSRRSRHVRRR